MSAEMIILLVIDAVLQAKDGSEKSLSGPNCAESAAMLNKSFPDE
jgi:hypothetical protein